MTRRSESPTAATLAYGAGQAARLGWYLGHYALTRRWFARLDAAPRPARRSLRNRVAGARIQAALARGVLELLARDLADIRAGVYPLPPAMAPRPAALADAARYWRDLPRVALRRRHRSPGLVAPEGDGYPDYYLQSFHDQSGGWLTAESAALYDTQVEVLFGGLADAMRRRGLPPVIEFLRQRGSPTGAGLRLLDLATGTGAMLSAVATACPELSLNGLDLSDAYLQRARHRLSGRTVRWHRAPAEAIPLPDASLDLVTAVYLFHELPPEVRPEVLGEVARVLKPGGRLVLVDSLQLGDVAALDPVLRGFPEQFHEPYFRDWIAADVNRLLASSGFTPREARPAYLSKVFVADRA